MNPHPSTSLSLNQATNFQGPTTSAKKRFTLISQTLDQTERLQAFGMHFKEITQELQEFLTGQSVQGNVFHLSTSNTLLGSIKVNQALKLDKARTKGSFIFMNSSSLLRQQSEVMKTFRNDETR